MWGYPHCLYRDSLTLMEYNVRNIVLEKSYRKRVRKTSSIPLFVFRKALYEVKQLVSSLIPIHFGSPRSGRTIKFQTVDPGISSILVFQKGSGTSLSARFCK